MLYNPLLDTFIAVAEAGSFSKASVVVSLSPTAIMKQINSLEDQLGFKLLERGPSGIVLTEAGKAILVDAKFLVEYSRKSITEIKVDMMASERTFCVGTSILNPAKPFMDLWYRLTMDGGHYFSDYKIHLVPFEDNHTEILNVISRLGELFDFIVGVCDSRQWLSVANFAQLGTYKKVVAVPRDHPLAKKRTIEIEDLKGETLVMVPKGDSPTNDAIRADLETNYPEIVIEDSPQFYDMAVFNKCAEEKKILLAVECWGEVHPGLVLVNVNWKYAIPYGLLYSKKPTKDILDFVSLAREIAIK